MQRDGTQVVAGRVTQSLEPFMLRLYPLLERQKRGDTLMLSEIERQSGTTAAAHPGILQRVFSWLNKRGVRAKMQDGGVYLLTAEEQALQFPGRDFAKARRHAARTLARIVAVPPSDLGPKEREKQELLASVAQAQLAHAVGASKESAFVLTGKQNKRLGE